jgi:hypothetical protein
MTVSITSTYRAWSVHVPGPGIAFVFFTQDTLVLNTNADPRTT